MEPDKLPDFDELLPEFQDSDFFVTIKVIANLINCDFSIDYYDPDVKYNKKYFAKYYDVDEKTFNKWVDIFCSKRFRDNYAAKRRFYKTDWETIIRTFGQCNLVTKRPYSRSEITKLVNGMESKISAKINIDCSTNIDRYMPNKAKNLNIFPPEAVYGFLRHLDAPEINHTIAAPQTEFTPKLKLRIMLGEAKKAINMSEQEKYKFKKEVKRFLGLQ